MKKRKSYQVIRIAALAIALLFMKNIAFAQSEDTTSLVVPDSMLLEVQALNDVFADTTNTDTLKFTRNMLSDPSHFIGYEILNGSEVLDLVSQYELFTGTPDNNVIFEMTTSFTYNDQEYEKRYSYGIERKTFNYVIDDNTIRQNIYCLHIVEKIAIPNDSMLSETEITNDYYLLYDSTTLLSIYAYNESYFENILLTGKYYYDPSQSANKDGTNANNSDEDKNIAFVKDKEYLTIAPNPAKTNVRFDVMLKQTDNAEIIITDVAGKTVKKINMGMLDRQVNYSHTENLSKLSPGVYMVKLSTAHVSRMIKLIIF